MWKLAELKSPEAAKTAVRLGARSGIADARPPVQLADALDALLGARPSVTAAPTRSPAARVGTTSAVHAAQQQDFAKKLEEQLQRRRPSLEQESKRVMRQLEDAEALTRALKAITSP